MLKLITITIILLNTSYAEIAEVDSSTINYLRKTFYKAIESEETTEELENFILEKFSDNQNNYEPIILAYYGGIEALKAKHAFNPFSKLSYIMSSLDNLEEAVNENPDNLEIRFMRYSILHHLPGILGYSEERENDKDKILKLLMQKNYSVLNSEIQKGIIDFMIESERLNETEVKELQRLIGSFTDNE